MVVYNCISCGRGAFESDSDAARTVLGDVGLPGPAGLCPVCAYEKARHYCRCGSGEFAEPVYDGRGIYLCKVCDKCRREKLRGYRPEILSGHYDESDVDEPIEADY